MKINMEKNYNLSSQKGYGNRGFSVEELADDFEMDIEEIKKIVEP